MGSFMLQWKIGKSQQLKVSPLPQWKNPDGTFVIAYVTCGAMFSGNSEKDAKPCCSGDCAHAMLPYMAQGANSALEDGATTGALLSKVRLKDQIPTAMSMYDTIRRPRLDQLVRETFLQAREHHLSDGEEQEKRDALLGLSMETTLDIDGKEAW